MNSLKSRIAVIFSVIIIVLVLAGALLIEHDVQQEITASEVRNAKNILEQVVNIIDNKYADHLFYRKALLDERKEGLKHIADVAMGTIENVHQQFLAGDISEDEAKRLAKETLRVMRYQGESGYVWIQDTTLPIPNMLMHPSVARLEGKRGDDPIYYQALGGKKNLLAEFVRAAKENDGTAFVAYRWPKPTPKGLTALQEKVSFVRIFQPWGWLIGTGVYTDDIENACQTHFDRIIDELSVDLGRIKMGRTGYVYVFNGDYDVLIHPNAQGTNVRDVKNPITGGFLFQEIKTAAHTPESRLEYLWSKPGEPDDRTYHKVAYVRHLDDLDWYVASSIYRDELEESSSRIRTKILWGSILFLLLTPLLAWWVARGISQPLADLATATEQIGSRNLSEVALPVGGTYETRSLSCALQNMIDRVSRDIEEQKRLETQLRQSEKMQAIGHLAGGIAHDLNNMLTGILGGVELLASELPGDGKTGQFLNMIGDAANRATDLTQNLLSFSRKSKNASIPMDLHKIINDACELLERSIDKRIVLSTDLSANVTTVLGEPTHIQNVILNLGINARDAMPDGGDLVIRTKNVTFDDAHALNETLAKPGPYVELSVWDTGIGMSEVVRDHVFEPFFTTKEAGKGTGLGLASVYRTVKDHNGGVMVESSEGDGSVFKVYLPVEEVEVPVDAVPEEDVVRGEGCILLVDDEQIIRTTSGHLIERLGYDVLLAEDGRHAIEIFKRNRERVDLVLLDVVMPRMGGRETFHKLREIDPKVKVIFFSGFTRELSVERLICDGALAFLAKPFKQSELSREIAKALASDSDATA